MNTTAKQINPSSAAAEDLVLQELGNGVATLTLNRPRQLNRIFLCFRINAWIS